MSRHNELRFRKVDDQTPRDGTVIIARNRKDRGYPYSYKARFRDGRWWRLERGGTVVPVAVEPLEWREAPRMAATPAQPHSIGPRL